MKKLVCLGCCLLAMLHAACAFTQEYFTLPQVREQAAQGWRQAYTDRYGRRIAVDVDVQVFGEDAAPVIRAGGAHASLNRSLLPEGAYARDEHDVVLCVNNPADAVFQTGAGERALIVYRSYGEKVDADRVYMPEYGAGLTLRHMVEHLCGVLSQHGIPAAEFAFDQPFDFSVRCRVKKGTGEVVEPAVYMAFFWQELAGMPVLEHAASALLHPGWPDFRPQLVMYMRGDDEYCITVQTMEELERLAQDIPLCSFEQARGSVERLIEQGYVREVLDMRLGLVAFNDPGLPKTVKYQDEAQYVLVPSWVVSCVYMDNPEREYGLQEPHDDELNPDVRTQRGFATLILNAQTGRALDRADTGRKGEADYKGFVLWDEVR